MLYVYGGVPVDPAQHDAVSAAAVPFQTLNLAEPGCIEYNLSWSNDNPDFLRLLEVWESVETHAAHTQQAHTLDWTTFVAAAATAPPTFTKYIVEVVS